MGEEPKLARSETEPTKLVVKPQMWLRNGLEPWHLLIVIVAFIVLFGPKRLPGAAKGLAQSLRIFKKELRDDERPSEHAATQAATPTSIGPDTNATPPSDAQVGRP